MSGWSGWNGAEGHGAEGSGPEHGPGAERGPGEERGRAAWTADEPSAPPPWAWAQTQSAALPPPPWASAETGTAPVPPPPPPWTAAPARTDGPVPSPAYAPAPRRVHGGRLVALVVAMALVGAGSGFGVWYLGRDRSGGGTPSASAPAGGVTASASASASASTTPRTPASTPPPASRQLPAGYRLVHDPVGYTLAVPEGWTRRQKQGEKATVVFYDSPSDGRQLQIFELAESTVTESLDLAENDPGYGYSHEPGYQALARSSGDSWAELSYRYDDPDKGARRVVDHRFRTADGTLYAIRSSGPEHLSDAHVRAPLTTALASFCLTGASCS